MTNFEEELMEFLANNHLSIIQTDIIIPSINQIIDDLEDYLFMVRNDDDEEEIKINKDELEKWKKIKEMIK